MHVVANYQIKSQPLTFAGLAMLSAYSFINDFILHKLLLFYKNNFIRTRGSNLLKILEQIKNNTSLGKKKNMKIS